MKTPQNKPIITRATMEGLVVAKSGQKTIKIEVVRRVQHPLYRKQVRRTKRYLVHDPLEKAVVGQVVTVRQSRPISKTKRWTLV